MLISRGMPPSVLRKIEPTARAGGFVNGFMLAAGAMVVAGGASPRGGASSRLRGCGGGASASGEDAASSSPAADSVPTGFLFLALRLARAPAFRAASASTTATAASAVDTADWNLATTAGCCTGASLVLRPSTFPTTAVRSAQPPATASAAAPTTAFGSLVLLHPSTFPAAVVRSARPPAKASTTAPATASALVPDLVTAGTPTVARLVGKLALATVAVAGAAAGLATVGGGSVGGAPLPLEGALAPLLATPFWMPAPTVAAAASRGTGWASTGGPAAVVAAGFSPGLQPLALATATAKCNVKVRATSDN
mmetsp:Transcript_135917/g.378790  ORF Transcript_135917/g.378790 Transcript_135917/m.378790 type:complete len:310 (+) Transcript_135917:449-1378(+)